QPSTFYPVAPMPDAYVKCPYRKQRPGLIVGGVRPRHARQLPCPECSFLVSRSALTRPSVPQAPADLDPSGCQPGLLSESGAPPPRGERPGGSGKPALQQRLQLANVRPGIAVGSVAIGLQGCFSCMSLAANPCPAFASGGL